MRIVHKVFDQDETHEFAGTIDGEYVIQTQKGGRIEVKIAFYTDHRQIERVQLYRFANQQIDKRSQFTIDGSELRSFEQTIRVLQRLSLESDDGERLDDDLIGELIDDALSQDDASERLQNHLPLILEFVKNNITHQDIVSLGYRKRQLDAFDNMLHQEGYFDKVKLRLESETGKNYKDEAVWQEYFERNSWIFGYGLQYIFSTEFEGKSLEQTVAGASIADRGKRADGLMKSAGALSSICFVEIKLPTHKLLAKQYRPGCWPPSPHLIGAIAQAQTTVQKAVKTWGTKLEVKDADGFIESHAYMYQPKSFVVIGNLNEFMHGTSESEDNFASFQLFRRNISSPEIITFDELCDRARYIVEHTHFREDKTDPFTPPAIDAETDVVPSADNSEFGDYDDEVPF